MGAVLERASDRVCEELLEICLEEDWALLDYRKGEKYWALKRYLKDIFERLVYEAEHSETDQKKVLIDSQGLFGVINTGIVDKHYEYIFAILDVEATAKGRLFRIRGFFVPRDYCRSSAHSLFKKKFKVDEETDYYNMPDKPGFFSNKQAVFDGSLEFCYSDYSHIILDRLYRFPHTYISKVCYDSNVGNLLTTKMSEAQEADEAGDYRQRDSIMSDEVRPILLGNEGVLFRRVLADFDDAVHTSVRRATYNYSTAALGYYPKQRIIQYYLPICIEYEERPDFALVVSYDERGGRRCYSPNTIISLDDAYANTRLVLPPVENWIYAAASTVRKANDEKYLSPRTAVAPKPSEKNAEARLLCKGRLISVKSGYLIGANRGSDERYAPDIALDASYRHISRRQGLFECRYGTWTFTSLGPNKTRIFRGREERELETGMPFQLLNDDILVFPGCSDHYVFLS